MSFHPCSDKGTISTRNFRSPSFFWGRAERAWRGVAGTAIKIIGYGSKGTTSNVSQERDCSRDCSKDCLEQTNVPKIFLSYKLTVRPWNWVANDGGQELQKHRWDGFVSLLLANVWEIRAQRILRTLGPKRRVKYRVWPGALEKLPNLARIWVCSLDRNTLSQAGESFRV